MNREHDPLSTLSGEPRGHEYPALSALRLDEADWLRLTEQGFVSEHRRGDKRYHKLRFRRDCHQVVRYIGGSERADAVRAELARLQSGLHRQRDLAQLAKTAPKMLRAARRQFEPLLLERGYRFHGMAIRRRRIATASVC